MPKNDQKCQNFGCKRVLKVSIGLVSSGDIPRFLEKKTFRLTGYETDERKNVKLIPTPKMLYKIGTNKSIPSYECDILINGKDYSARRKKNISPS